MKYFPRFFLNVNPTNETVTPHKRNGYFLSCVDIILFTLWLYMYKILFLNLNFNIKLKQKSYYNVILSYYVVFLKTIEYFIKCLLASSFTKIFFVRYHIQYFSGKYLPI